MAGNAVGSICVFSYLDNRNIERLDDGPGRGKQQHVVPYVFRYEFTCGVLL